MTVDWIALGVFTYLLCIQYAPLAVSEFLQKRSKGHWDVWPDRIYVSQIQILAGNYFLNIVNE